MHAKNSNDGNNTFCNYFTSNKATPSKGEAVQTGLNCKLQLVK